MVTALSQQVEILRCPVTLFFSSGNVAGLVDVADGKIPKKMPRKRRIGRSRVAFEQPAIWKNLTSAGINIGYSPQLRAAYRRLVPQIRRLRRTRYQRRRPSENLPDSRADSKQAHRPVLAWDKGFLGVAYNDRRDRYGLPATAISTTDCHADIIWQKSLINKRYLQLYPHLLTEEDVDYDNPGLSCTRR